MYMEYVEGANPFAESVRKEFVTRRAQPTGRYGEPVLTPRKYVTRKCSAPSSSGVGA